MIVVFTGPTISAEDARNYLDAVYLGPVAQGDVYRATLDQPAAIAIIDGYFEHVPSVWHKEILYAMTRGVHVFGASSMGALRAAELERFGMVGVGRVFAAFRDRVLEDDDEVAVAHGPAESGYRAASDAMVNIRATLEAAPISPATRAELLRVAKSTFYAQRSYSALRSLPEAEPSALPAVPIDQKRLDAIELLQTLAAFAADPPPPKEVSFYFHHTEVWDQVSRRLGRQQLNAAASAQNALLLDELRISGEYAHIRSATLFRALALEYAQSAGLSRELDRVRWVEALFEDDVDRQLRDELRARGRLSALEQRALDKQTKLAAAGLANPSLAEAGIDEEALFQTILGRPRSDRLYEELGFKEHLELVQVLLREHHYRLIR